MENKPLHAEVVEGLIRAAIGVIDTLLRIGFLVFIVWVLPDGDGSLSQKTIEEVTLKEIFVTVFLSVAVLQFLFPPRVEITRK